MTPERIGQILLALHLAGWRVTTRRRGNVSRVTLRAPVSWYGEPITVHAGSLAEGLASAWSIACEHDPGPAQRMAEIGGTP